ncbi:MAG TPA: tetratricopeptide repeat protein [Vicinamibacterales bacterium]|nr:tetratricopeptide repeat protein [Vicinamibacterales bacterium]
MRTALVCFLTGVFVLKLVVVLQLRDHPLVQPDVGLDTTAYAELARRVVAGDIGLGPGLYYVSPLYIYVLAAILFATDSFTAARLIQIFLGTAAVGFIFVMAREWFGERAARVAAVFAAFTGLFTFYEALILQASIDVFLTSAALLCLTLALRRGQSARGPRGAFSLIAGGGAPAREKEDSESASAGARASGGGAPRALKSDRWFLLSGLVFGIQSLNRPNMTVAVAGLATVLLVTRRFRPAALLAAGLLIGMAPAAIRNVVVTREWSLVSSHGGLNFYIGNSETATGFYHQVPGITPNIAGQERDARRIAERALGRRLSEAETSDYFFGLAWTWIRQHPGAAIKLFARKLGYVFNAQHIALPYSYPFYAYDAETMLRFYAVGPWLLVPLGLVGLVFAAPSTRSSKPAVQGAEAQRLKGSKAQRLEDSPRVRKRVVEKVRLEERVRLGNVRGDYLIWLSFVPCYAASVAVFLVAERYRLPLLVPLCIGAGAAVDAAISAIAAKRARILVAPAVVFVVLFALANWRHGLHDGRWEEGLRMAQRLVILGRYDEAEQWVARFEPQAPRAGMAHHGVGMQLLVVNQTDRAIAHLAKAHELDPGQPAVEYALGQALLKAGRAKDAVPHLQRGFDAGIEIPLGGYDLAVALHAIGDFRAAADVIRRIRLSDDSDHELWLRVGRLATEVKAPDAAEPFFRHAVGMRPDQASARQQYGLNLLVLGRYEEAARELAEAVRLDSSNADTLSHLAYCELKLGRPADAAIHAGAALALDPDNPLAKQVAAAVRQPGPGRTP